MIKKAPGKLLRMYLAALLPGLISVFLHLFLMGLMRSQIFIASMPLVILMGVFYWSAFRPSLMPYPLVFALGLMQDALSSVPLGITSIFLLASRVMCLKFLPRIHMQGFYRIWAAFTLLAALNIICYAIGFVLVIGQPPMAEPFVMQFIFTVFLYPLVHLIHTAIYNLNNAD